MSTNTHNVLIFYETNTVVYKFITIYDSTYTFTNSVCIQVIDTGWFPYSHERRDLPDCRLRAIYKNDPIYWESIYQYSLTPWNMYYEI